MARRESFEDVLAAFAANRAERIEDAKSGHCDFPAMRAAAARYIAKGHDRDDDEGEFTGTDLDTGDPRTAG